MQKAAVCTNCGRRTMAGEGGHGLPKNYRTCSRCTGTVCSDCVDWTAGSGGEVVCSQCSGRTAPRQGKCD